MLMNNLFAQRVLIVHGQLERENPTTLVVRSRVKDVSHHPAPFLRQYNSCTVADTYDAQSFALLEPHQLVCPPV